MSSTRRNGTVVALAGRRIDPEPAAAPRFPFAEVERVRGELADALRAAEAAVLVCSAACGADLVALDVAEDMGLRTRIVLPLECAVFRRTSVVDRPRPHVWGALFDRVTDAARGRGDLVELGYAEGEEAAYSATNAAIVEEACKMAGVEVQASTAGSPPLLALVVWEGVSRGSGDHTQGFADLAKARGFRIQMISTRDTAAAQP